MPADWGHLRRCYGHDLIPKTKKKGFLLQLIFFDHHLIYSKTQRLLQNIQINHKKKILPWRHKQYYYHRFQYQNQEK